MVEFHTIFLTLLVTITKINYYHRKVHNFIHFFYWKVLSGWEQSKWGCEWICKFYSCSNFLLNWLYCLHGWKMLGCAWWTLISLNLLLLHERWQYLIKLLLCFSFGCLFPMHGFLGFVSVCLFVLIRWQLDR